MSFKTREERVLLNGYYGRVGREYQWRVRMDAEVTKLLMGVKRKAVLRKKQRR